MKQKHALITGGTKGIGWAIARVLIEMGYRVAITGRSQSSVDEALEQCPKNLTTQLKGIVSDVRNLHELSEAVEQIHHTWGPLDVVIANAGVGHFAPIDEMSEAQWSETIDVNLTGVFNTTKATVEDLKKTKGYLITIASLAGTNFFPKGAAYNASKFGLVGFSQAVMLDMRKYGIKVTTIMPGSVSTHFNGNIPSDADAWKIQPEDLGQMVKDLLNMNPRTLPSKIEVRPSQPPKK